MPAFPDNLTLEPLFDAAIDLAPPENIGATPFGNRIVFVVTGGTFEGPRMRGRYRSGGDWFLSLPNGAGELDVRATLETDDGALIYMAYRGVLDVPAGVMARAMRGEHVDENEYYFRTAPRFEAGDERYAWLNKTVCVATGWFGPNKVGYRVFAVK
jgi:hypothetical protein